MTLYEIHTDYVPEGSCQCGEYDIEKEYKKDHCGEYALCRCPTCGSKWVEEGDINIRQWKEI